MFFPFIIAYVIGFVAVLVSGKSKKKRMDEIAEDEKFRQLIKSEHEDRPQKAAFTNPNGKTINDMYKR